MMAWLKRGTIAGVGMLLASCATSQGPWENVTASSEVMGATLLTPAEAQEDLELARKGLEAIHPGYTRYASAERLDEAWAAVSERASEPITDAELYLLVSQLLAEIRCDHTKAETPGSLETLRREGETFFPFRPKLVDGQAYVFSASEASGLKPGDRILSIRGVAMDEIQETILPMLAVDGWTDFVRPRHFEEAGEYFGSGFEQFYHLFFGSWVTADLEIERDGARQSVSVSAIGWDAWNALTWPGAGFRPDFRDSVFFEIVDEGVGLLRIDTFVNYRRPINPERIYGPIFQQLEDEKIETLIIDTRINGGGSDDANHGLLSHLLNSDAPYMRAKSVKTIDMSEYQGQIRTWNPSALTPNPDNFEPLEDGWYALKPKLDPLSLQPMTLREPRFDGQIIALSSGNNSSGVSMMLATLRDRTDAIIVGERTGGSSEGPTAGIIYFLVLPNSDIVVRIPWQLQELNVARPERGLGVTPDIVVEPTLEDLLGAADPALEKALSLASGG